jgi:hypothetical protein
LKNTWKIIWQSLTILIAGILLGFLFLLIAYSIPVSLMEERVSNSAEMLKGEFDQDVILERYQGTYLGTFTDCLMLQIAIYEEGEHSTIDRAVNVYRKEISEEVWMPGVSLMNYLNDRSGVEISYARYWHGYLVVLKPTLLFFDMAEIRLLNLMVLSLLTFSVGYLLQKKGKMKYNLAFFGAIFSMYPMAIYMSISQSICIYIMLMGMLFYLQFEQKIHQKNNRIYFFLILGMMTSYLDLLTYPILPLGACLLLYLILFDPKGLAGLKYIITTSFSYGLGYVMMWLGKWVLAWIFGTSNIWKDAFTTIGERSGGVEGISFFTLKIEAIKRNIEMLINKPMLLFFIIVVIIAVIAIWKQGLISLEDIIKRKGLFLLVACYPILWYAFADNHSYIHYMFTYREMFLFVFACFAWMLSLSKINRREND